MKTRFTTSSVGSTCGRRVRLANARRRLAQDERVFVGQLAIKKGYLKAGELEELLRDQKTLPGPRPPLGSLLLKRGIVSPSQMVELLREQRRHNLLHLFHGKCQGAPEEVWKLLADPSRHLEQYILVEKIGSGGTGTVWKAWDQRLRRWVAIKTLRGESGADLRRFVREARAVARLRHPRIITIHKVSEHEGRPFLVMDYVEGGSLEGSIFAPAAAARLMADVARAMHYAHRRGVIHRDLKPANLLKDATGAVTITDFGLAALHQAGSRHDYEVPTATGTVLGTPAYMPPEQARGDQSEGDVRCDVYSMGATLYRMVTGRAPFRGAAPAEILLKVLHESPLPLRGVPRALQAIILKCMEKNPHARYGSAAELADDLERFLRGDPVQARPSPKILRILFSLRRARLRLMGSILVGIVAAVLTVAIASVLRSPETGAPADMRGENRVRLIDEALRRNPDSARLLVHKSRILRLRGSRKEALRTLEETIRRHPNSPGAYLERALLRLDEFRSSHPLDVFRGPSSPLPKGTLDDLDRVIMAGDRGGKGAIDDVRLARGYRALYGGRPREARRLFLDLYREGVRPGESTAGLARAYYLCREYDRAVAAFAEALALRPTAPHLRQDLASARRRSIN